MFTIPSEEISFSNVFIILGDTNIELFALMSSRRQDSSYIINCTQLAANTQVESSNSL